MSLHVAEKNSTSIGVLKVKANEFYGITLLFFRLSGRDEFINGISNNFNLLYVIGSAKTYTIQFFSLKRYIHQGRIDKMCSLQYI